MDLTELKEEYATQDNRATAFPIFVTVQELAPVGVIADGYSVCGDGEERYEHNCDGCEDYPCFGEDASDSPDNCKYDVQMGYIWQDIEWFLTIKGAKEFMESSGLMCATSVEETLK